MRVVGRKKVLEKVLRLGALPLAVLLLAHGTALGGAQRPCTQPAVFQGAAVNSLVLPYSYVGREPSDELHRASRQIAALVHFHILFSMLKYGSVGSTDLVALPGETCDVEEVITEVTRGLGPGSLLAGQTLVVTWGRLFEQGEQLYVQSYVRFLRQGDEGPVPETIEVSSARDEMPLNLVASLPAQSIAFPPRSISKKDLEKVSAEFTETMRVREHKDPNEPGESIDFDPDVVYPYGVTRSEGDWMWIEPMRGGPKGWVRARTGDSSETWSLERWLPELSYVDAISGFMRLRAWGGIDDDAVRKRIIDGIDRGFQRFRDVVPEREAPAAYGLARAIRGYIDWNAASDRRQRASAARALADTLANMPEYAAARNLAAVTRPVAADTGFDEKSAARLGRDLLSALALDPSDRMVLDNLGGLYQLFEKRPEWSPFAADELKQRLAIVQAATDEAR